MTNEQYRALAPVKRLVLFLHAFVPEEMGQKGVWMLMGGRFRANPDTVKGVCRDLERVKELKSVRRYGSETKYALAGRCSLALLRAMVAEADEQGWWPTSDAIHRAMGNAEYWEWPAERLRRAKWIFSLMVFVRQIVLGAADPLGREQLKACESATRPLCRAAVAYLENVLGEVPDLPEEPFGLLCKADFLAAWLNFRFLFGRDARGILAAVDRWLKNDSVRVEPALAETYAALCVWTGWREGLAHERLNCFDKIGAICQDIFEGAFAGADKALRAAFEKVNSRYEADDDFDNFSFRLLRLTVSMAVKIGTTRQIQMMRGRLGDVRSRSVAHEYVSVYEDATRTVSRGWVDCWKAVVAGKGEIIRHPDLSQYDILDVLLGAWDYRFLAAGRQLLRERVKKMLEGVRLVEKAGYLNMSGLALALFWGGFDATAVSDIVARMDERGVWFFPRTDPEPEWKELVARLQKLVARKERAASRAEEEAEACRIVWSVEMRVSYNDADNYEIERMSPVLRVGGSKKAIDSGQPLHFDDLSKAKYRRWASEADILFAKTVLANNDSYTSYYKFGAEEFELMCGMTNFETPEYGESRNSYSRVKTGSRPVRFVKQSCQMTLTAQEDGGVALSVPDWVEKTTYPFALRKIGEDTYAYIPVPGDVRKVIETLQDFCVGGKVTLPGAAMKTVAPVLERLADILPVAESTPDGAQGLRRVTAESGCTVRLDFTEETLHVRAVVLPIPGNAEVAFEPGVGLAEKIVAGALGSYVLVRDLEAERAQFARVKEALAACEGWFDGKSAWDVDDIAGALSALTSLKALEPPVPLEWQDDHRLKVTSAPKSGVALESFRTADEWFSVKGTFRLDDGRVLSVVEMLAAMKSRAGGYVRLSDGDYLALTRTMAKELDALAAVGRRKGDGVEVTRAALPMLDGVFGEGEDELALPEAMAKSASEIRTALARRPEPPPTLTAELRPYQLDGYRWLSRLAACGLGACLADDMGLGKTLQVIALLLERATDGASLVVVPSSVCGNWRREIRRFAPTLEPILALEEPEAALAAGPRAVVIASYGYLLFHEDAFAGRDWNGVVLDEAQAIKNDASKRARLVKRLKGRFRLAATGTPVENRLGELWSLFDFLNPGLLGAATSFAARFTKDGVAVPALKRIVKPLVLRRLKGDVLDDLPEKTEVTIPVVLGETERSAYEGCRLHALASLQAGDGEANRISILAELTRLRRFCCHPSLVLGEGDVPSAKMEALVDILEGLRAGGHRALVFSQFTDYLAIVRKVVAAHGWSHKYLDGATPTLERERLVSEFQGGDGDFFLISLKAGGTGLNLTAANYVILLDPWWNPAVENQAADRAHRIGQTQPVTIYRLVAEDTVEERVIELHRQKTAMAVDLLDGTSNASFSPEDLLRLFR